MIKFFRKLRYNLMETGKTKKYLLYAIGEIFLVVIGILIHLKFTNKNVIFPSWEGTKGWVLRWTNKKKRNRTNCFLTESQHEYLMVLKFEIDQTKPTPNPSQEGKS